LYTSLFAVFFQHKLINARTAPKFGADMSVLVWVSLPKLRISQLMEKMVNSLTPSPRMSLESGFSRRMLSDTEKGLLREKRISSMRMQPAAAHNAAFALRHGPMHENRPGARYF